MEDNILITGCSSGIGKHCALTLHELGYNVFATARLAEDIETLKALGLKTYSLDLRYSDSIKSCIQEVLKDCGGKIDILFNNGAYGQPGAVEDLKREVLIEQFETNVFGTQEFTNEIIKVMRQNGRGKIVYNSSVLGFVALKLRGAYNSSKFAIEGLADTLRLELMGSGIHICLIEPGPIRSNFRANAHKMFIKNVDIEGSYFKDVYKEFLKKYDGVEDDKSDLAPMADNNTIGSEDPFTLGPNSVFEVLLKIVKSKNPKPRYRVTVPSKLFWVLRRVLSTRMLDRILSRI